MNLPLLGEKSPKSKYHSSNLSNMSLLCPFFLRMLHYKYHPICVTIWSSRPKYRRHFQNWAIDTVIEHSISGFVWCKSKLHLQLQSYEYLCIYFLMYFFVFYFLFLSVSQFRFCQLWPPLMDYFRISLGRDKNICGK